MNLEWLNLRWNLLTNLTLPEGLTNLKSLHLENNQLTSLTLPDGLMNLEWLNLHSNQLTNLTLPEGLTNLRSLDLENNQLTSLTLPDGLTALWELRLSSNDLTNFTLPDGLTNLEYLYLHSNQLTSLALPKGLTNLWWLEISDNQLTNLFLSPDMVSRYLRWRLFPRLFPRLRLFIEDNPWMRIRQSVGLNIKFDVGTEHYSISYYDLPASPKISRVGNGLEISWDDGVLQSAVDVDGPWQDVIAGSPLRVTPSLSSEFFRVRSKEQWIDVERRILPLK